ncbi:TIR-like protein FxsC [Kitasatospora sp. MAP5-34]|uniref:TIR-like protein FxsC n=1 Tax=Kitasatospora sp. MAP5-34 TaxID=3035102 RepID=UPI0024759422|nr:TIR-like protein FxsC [Kitasatospora sp. MAP5-34]MDH6574928.1 hypothetical protein [Kitasatospora sp. MAP5-34]
MSSDKTGPPDPPPPTAVDRLSELLTELGRPEPGPIELAELLWLAARSGEHGAGTDGGSDADENGARRRNGGAADPGTAAGGAGGPGRGAGQSLRTALHLPSDDPADGVAAAAVPTPSAPMLARPLALQRALRPLKRQVPDPKRALLDETATANRLAEALRGPGPVRWLPVLRPGTERWLDLQLVLDCGPTMAVWYPLALELRTLLRQTGAFRQVGLSRLDDSGRLARRRPSDARTAVLVLSDCMGPQWRPGVPGLRWHRTLHALARRCPVAVVQPLPERLWQLAALPAVAGLLSAPEAGVPNSAYGFAPFADGTRRWGEVAVPVLEAGAGWLGNWARLVGSPAGGQVVGSALLVGPSPVLPEADALAGPEPDELAAEELILRFRSVASREAFTLAGLTALTTPALPVMRLLQRASFARPQPQHLAEVVVSGLLKEREGRRDHFEFRSGVRELLLRTLPRSTTHQAVGLLARVGEQIAARAGRVPNEFAALAATDPECAGAGCAAVEGGATDGSAAAPGGRMAAERHAFALISPAALRMLDGPRAPVLRLVPESGSGPAAAGSAARSLPDPARSRAVLLLTTSRAAEGEPLSPDDFRAHGDLTGLAAALSSRALVGLSSDHLWLGLDDLQGFLRALRTAASEAQDTLVVYVGGEVTALPGEGLVLGTRLPGDRRPLPWTTLLSLVSDSRAVNRLLVLDGWQDSETIESLEPFGAQEPVHQLLSIRPPGERSLAGRLNQLLRDGEPGGEAELSARHLLLALQAQVAEEQRTSRTRFWFRLHERSFLLSRNPAVSGPPSLQSSPGRQPTRRLTTPSHSRPQPRTGQEPTELAAPYFFLSYAREAQPYGAVEQLFGDLAEEILQLTDLPGAVPAGFLDHNSTGRGLTGRSDGPGGRAARSRVTEALATCRVFVPLYSPGYFLDERCGKEWSAFEQRPRGAGWSSGIVPALWAPVRRAELPEVASRLQYVDSRVELYESEGLFGLSKSQPPRERYELAVHRLATRIVEVAHTAGIPPGPPPDWDTLVNAFATSPPPGG